MDDEVTVEALVAAAVAGDEEAWDRLIDRYAPLVLSVLGRYRVFGADAADVSQIVWLRLVEHLGELREPRALPMWLITTSRNECVRLLRAGRRTEPYDPMQPNGATARGKLLAGDPDSGEPAAAMLAAERSQAVFEALAELTEQHRQLLLMLMEDPAPSYTEISERLGMPIGSIGPTRARALEKLRGTAALRQLLAADGESGREGRDGVALGRR